MNNINTMTLKEYIFEHLYWGIISMIWYRCLMFRSINTVSTTWSKTILWTLVILLSLIGILITYKRRRNHLSMVVNLIVPYEIYTLCAYQNILSWQVHFGLGIAILLSLLYIYMIFSQHISNANKLRTIIKNRIKKCLFGIRTIVSLCLAVVVVSIAVSSVFGISLTKSKVMPAKNDDFETWTISNNIEYVSMFFNESWDTCSSKEKMDAMQIIANIECQYLGLPHELTVITSCLSEDTLGAYDDKTHTIQINIEHFENSNSIELLDSICHEAYHAYQHRLVDAYDNVDEKHKKLLLFYNIGQ